ncbi:MAG: 3',5'-cyclic adenosine monophosphate phosphodiesterase CpdA [Chlamydiia bacterium]|nr:3',5'-cyclic adenosine monophosphate phosphodiesterase CpdA [Chlamydiia bacterium]
MKIAHISDIHFFNPSLKFSHLLSSKWLGYLNAYFKRRNYFITKHLDLFLASLKKEDVDILVITGDFTTISEPEEFSRAKDFITKAQDYGFKVFIIPGNHDVYTKKAFKKRQFYKHLNVPQFSNDKLHIENIHPNWDLILIDNTTINSFGKANGHFLESSDQTLKSLLNSSKNVIIGNHFPFFEPKQHRQLFRGLKLKEILLNSEKEVIFLHGHTHQTQYSNEKNLHIFNSSQVTVTDQFKYHIITLDDEKFTHQEIKYYD